MGLHKDEFLAMLGHELRNPLAPIRNALHLMQKPGATNAVVTWGREIIDRQTDHLTRLVDDLLDVSRIAHGKIKRQGRYAGQRPDWKKAYVKLREGEKMPEFLEGA